MWRVRCAFLAGLTVVAVLLGSHGSAVAQTAPTNALLNPYAIHCGMGQDAGIANIWALLTRAYVGRLSLKAVCMAP